MIGNQVTSKVLRGIDQAGDNRSPQIGALDKVEEGWVTASLLLNLDSSLYHGKLMVRSLLVFTSETFNGAKSFFFATLAEEPPGGFGGEEDEDQEGSLTCYQFVLALDVEGQSTYGEQPLQSQGHTPCPLVVTLVVGICGTGYDDRSNGPTHL